MVGEGSRREYRRLEVGGSLALAVLLEAGGCFGNFGWITERNQQGEGRRVSWASDGARSTSND